METRLFPFLCPYKGRRALYRQRSDTKKLLAKLEKERKALIGLWADHASNIGLSLSVQQRRGAAEIRWRATQKVLGHQALLDFSSNDMQKIREDLTPSAMRLLSAFEYRRISLNARTRCAVNNAEALERFAEESNVVTEWLPEYLREPMIKKPDTAT